MRTEKNMTGRTKVIEFVFQLSTGGAETLVKDYCLHLNKTKFEVVAICLVSRDEYPWQRLLAQAGIRVYYVDKVIGRRKSGSLLAKVIYRLRVLHYLCSVIRKEQPDVIHVHLSLFEYIVPLLPFIGDEIKYCYTLHSNAAAYFKGNVHNRMEYYLLMLFRSVRPVKVIALQQSMSEDLAENYGIKDTIVVNNGINLDHFRKVMANSVELRRSEGIPENAFVIGDVARFAPVKNHKLILQAFLAVHEMNPRAYLLLVGDGELKTGVKQWVREHGLTDSVKILSNRDDVPRLMHMMDVFFFPSLYEGLGIALIEAQAVGLHCVISNTIPEAAVVSNLVTRVRLNAPINEWCNALLQPRPHIIEYSGLDQWDIDAVCERLGKIYLGEI